MHAVSGRLYASCDGADGATVGIEPGPPLGRSLIGTAVPARKPGPLTGGVVLDPLVAGLPTVVGKTPTTSAAASRGGRRRRGIGQTIAGLARRSFR